MDNQAVLLKLIIMAVMAILICVVSLVWLYKSQATWKTKRFSALLILLIGFVLILISLI